MSKVSIPAGRNVVAHLDGNKLLLEIDLGKDLGLSKSKKSTLIASTSGSVTLPNGAKVGLNIFRDVPSAP